MATAEKSAIVTTISEAEEESPEALAHRVASKPGWYIICFCKELANALLKRLEDAPAHSRVRKEYLELIRGLKGLEPLP